MSRYEEDIQNFKVNPAKAGQAARKKEKTEKFFQKQTDQYSNFKKTKTHKRNAFFQEHTLCHCIRDKQPVNK